MTTPTTTKKPTPTTPAVVTPDVQELLDLKNATDDQLQEQRTFDNEREFLKLDVGDEIICFASGIKELPNGYFKPALPEGKLNSRTKKHAMLDVLVTDDKGATVIKKFLNNAIMVINYVDNHFTTHPDTVKFAVKISVTDQETNDNGTFLKCKFHTLPF